MMKSDNRAKMMEFDGGILLKITVSLLFVAIGAAAFGAKESRIVLEGGGWSGATNGWTFAGIGADGAMGAGSVIESPRWPKAACAERSIRFFDTSAAMAVAGTEGLISDSKLCMRFTYAGRALLAKGVLGAFGRPVAFETERIWKSYPGAENIEVGFSQKGYAELKRRAAAAGLRPQAYVEAIWR